MKYFWTGQERKAHKTTCCFEFQQGKYEDECWKETSLSLHTDFFDNTELYTIICKVLKDFEYYGITEVTQSQWEEIKALAKVQGGEAAKVIEELTPWAENTFQSFPLFTIIGI